MGHRRSTCAFTVAAALLVTAGSARADDAKYPNWKGLWHTREPRAWEASRSSSILTMLGGGHRKRS